jgi:hypothetical protein
MLTIKTRIRRGMIAIGVASALVGSVPFTGAASAAPVKVPAPGSAQAKADGCLALQLGYQQDLSDMHNNPNAGSKEAVAAANDAADAWGAANRGGCAWAQ